MTEYPALDRFLLTDPRDVGCDQALAVLHVYLDLVLAEHAGVLPVPATPASRHTCSRADRATTTTKAC